MTAKKYPLEIFISEFFTRPVTHRSVCFLIGSILFREILFSLEDPGKTESPGDLQQIIESITTKVFVLPDDTEIYPATAIPP